MTRSIVPGLLGAAAACCALAPHGAALAADLPRRASLLPTPPAFAWISLHAGVDGGFALGTGGDGFTDTAHGAVTGGRDIRFAPGSGVVLGVGTDVLGASSAEADAAYLGTTPHYGVRTGLDRSGTVRGRAGHAFDRVLIYAGGGSAYGDGSRPAYANPDPHAPPDTGRTGHVVGGFERTAEGKPSATAEARPLVAERGGSGSTYYGATVSAD